MKMPALKIFSILFGAAYMISFYMEWALFRYYPEFGEFHLRPRTDLGPPILWYGWLLTAGLFSGAVALVVPRSMAERLPAMWVWLIPVIVTVITLIYERRWFV